MGAYNRLNELCVRSLVNCLKELEARAGIEPAHKGFADLSLTTWVPRLGRAAYVNANRPKPPRPTRPSSAAAEWNGAGDEI